jgi:hypothetical protein
MTGRLGLEEIRQLLKDAYGSATDADALRFINLMDFDHDQQISWDELYYSLS